MLKLSKLPCEFIWEEVPSGSQSVDKNLIALLSADIASNGAAYRYCVVSKDKGYESVIHLLHRYFNVVINRKTSLYGTNGEPQSSKNEVKSNPESSESKQDSSIAEEFSISSNLNADEIQTVKKYINVILEDLIEITKNQIELLVKPFKECLATKKTEGMKVVLHNAFLKAWGASSGAEYYRKVKDRIK